MKTRPKRLADEWFVYPDGEQLMDTSWKDEAAEIGNLACAAAFDAGMHEVERDEVLQQRHFYFERWREVLATSKHGWDTADELQNERDALRAQVAKLRETLKNEVDYHERLTRPEGCCPFCRASRRVLAETETK